MSAVSSRRRFPWRRTLLVVLSGFLSYFLIPLGFTNYNEIKTLRDARQTRAVKFGSQNAEFNSQLNAAATLLRTVAAHNDRTKISGAQLREARQDLYKQFLERRLELDASVWWWPSEFARETSALNLLSAEETKQLNTYVDEYKQSVLATMNQLTHLWRFMDSPEYDITNQSREKRKEIERVMDEEFGKEYNTRNQLVSNIGQLLTQSNHRTNKLDLLGL